MTRISARGDPTAWLRMQSEAKRSRGRISLQFAICREIFRNCRESRSYCCQVFEWFQYLRRRPRSKEQGGFFGNAGTEQGAFLVLQGRAAFGIVNGGRVFDARGQAGLNAGPRFAEITPGPEFQSAHRSAPRKSVGNPRVSSRHRGFHLPRDQTSHSPAPQWRRRPIAAVCGSFFCRTSLT
jgi:hypothetical protein